MTDTTTRLVVSTIALCDGDQHEARIITDGATAHGYLIDAVNDQEGDLPTALISDDLGEPTLEVSCNALDTVTGDTCHGYYTVGLTRTGWAEDTEARSALDEYGHEVER